jgi:hypothetical protein
LGEVINALGEVFNALGEVINALGEVFNALNGPINFTSEIQDSFRFLKHSHNRGLLYPVLGLVGLCRGFLRVFLPSFLFVYGYDGYSDLLFI